MFKRTEICTMNVFSENGQENKHAISAVEIRICDNVNTYIKSPGKIEITRKNRNQ